jgi:hypothetical protein
MFWNDRNKGKGKPTVLAVLIFVDICRADV